MCERLSSLDICVEVVTKLLAVTPGLFAPPGRVALK
jgi:hypothetical protein